MVVISVGKIVYSVGTTENITGEPIKDTVDTMLGPGKIKDKVEGFVKQSADHVSDNLTEVVLTQAIYTGAYNIVKKEFEKRGWNKSVSVWGFLPIKAF